MKKPSRRTKLFFYEGTKVLVIFAAFYLLQGQIFHVRYDIYGRTRGLAHAQERTSTELDDTQRFLEMTMDDVEESHASLSRTRRTLEASLQALREERERVVQLIEGRTSDFEEKLSTRIKQGWQEVEAVRAVAEAHASRLQVIGSSSDRSPREMKRRMLFPTVQLRGNGTVGSGVLIYSERQPAFSDDDVYTTFAITAYHVVAEVMAERLEGVLDEVHVMVDGNSDATRVHSARLILFDKPRDVALLRLETQERLPFLAELMRRDKLGRVDVFSAAYAVGCPLGNRPLPTLGEVSSKSKVVGEQTFWMLNAPTFFGNSGGGIYAVPSCELIGVSSMIYTYGKNHPTVVPHMGLFVPLATIYSWLDDEGYGFVHRREPIPQRLRWKLAYLERDAAVPQPAASSSATDPTPGADATGPSTEPSTAR